MGLSLAYDAWLRSGLEADVDRVYRFDDIGELAVDVAFGRYAVRPASLDCDKFKKPRISRTFGVIARIYNAWLRSGNRDYAYNVRLLNSSGAPVYRDTDLRYAVRPASLDCDKFKKPRISRTFGSIARILRLGAFRCL